MRYAYLIAVAVFVSGPALYAQRRADPKNSYHRVIGVLPLVGSGTHDDPIRPKYAPAHSGGQSGAGIIAFAFELTDDGKYAVAELVAVDRASLAPMLADRSPRTAWGLRQRWTSTKVGRP
jgi:hypothetical protein